MEKEDPDSAESASFKSLLDALQYLKSKGFEHEFFLKKEGIWDTFSNAVFPFKDIVIEENIKIVVSNDPDLTSIIYGIKLPTGQRGLFLDNNATSHLD